MKIYPDDGKFELFKTFLLNNISKGLIQPHTLYQKQGGAITEDSNCFKWSSKQA